ncbi:MAG: hypothetical protein JKY65_12815 [Planctomycetes bacterium]|nr:hypothetical protein [Planctomycetota bacterium]
MITSHWLRGPAEKAELGRWTEGREGGSWTYAKIAETNRSGRLDLSSDGRLALLRHHVDVRGKNLGEVWYVGEFPPAPRRR